VTRRKKLLFAAAAIVLATSIATLALLVVDIYLHGRYERSAGYNVWGYRGPSLDDKESNEIRVAVLGGSTAFGYGVSWEESIPALLERDLHAPGAPVSVANLGYNNEGAYSLKFTLEDYLWLDYDLAILYDGYNDVTYNAPDMNRQVFRRDSPVFRWTGYLPIFPIIFKEKAASLLTGGEISAAYNSQQQTVFRPGLAARGAAGVLGAAVNVGDILQSQLNAVAMPEHKDASIQQAADCARPWVIYCESVGSAIAFARANNVDVLVVGQPDLHARHDDQQRNLERMIAGRFGQDSRVRYVSMRGTVNLSDASYSFDGMHLTAQGNRAVATHIAEAVKQFGLRRNR
jgi:hypothetical protein